MPNDFNAVHDIVCCSGELAGQAAVDWWWMTTSLSSCGTTEQPADLSCHHGLQVSHIHKNADWTPPWWESCFEKLLLQHWCQEKTGGLTWLPSRCQKTVGWGFPLVSQGNVAVRPCETIWSRGRTTNWGASEVKKLHTLWCRSKKNYIHIYI